MIFLTHEKAKFEIPGGVYLTCWLVDNSENREILTRFRDQVMLNKTRKAVYVMKGGVISLYVNRVSGGKLPYRRNISLRRYTR